MISGKGRMSNGESQQSITNAQMEYTNSCLREAFNLTGRGRVRNLIRRSLLPQVITYRNVRIHLHPNDNFSEFAIWRKGRSPEELELSWLQENFAGKSLKVVDIGANFGLYSLFFASILGPDSQIYAFEPNPTMFERFQRNCRLNDFNNIELSPFAISDKSGAASLSVELRGDTATNLGEAQLTDDPTHLDQSKYTSIPVQTKTLVELPHLHGADYAKLDVEGHEAAILLPFLEIAEDQSLPRYLQLETVNLGDETDSLLAAISDRGYENVFQTRRNTIFNR
ncbi:methyltransferase, FkbM family [Rhodobacteraceae bacterium KLH11]|nr:methyltransferase, FkbM family [Rhodobacteraceae bacterium KLH11]